MNIDKYYMCHYTKLVDRKKYIERYFDYLKLNIELDWITDFDKDSINYNELTIEYPNIFSLNQLGKKLTKPEISLCLKHIQIFRDVIKNNYQNVVVFEDDIILSENFLEKLNNYVSQLPKDYDVLWLGSCCELHADIIKGQNIYPMNSSRCTHAYLISKKGCERMIESIKFLNLPIDWFFNYVIQTKNLKSYWAEPDLARQNTTFDTSIQNSLDTI